MIVPTLRIFIAAGLLALVPALGQAQLRTAFSGVPSVRITEEGTERLEEDIPDRMATSLGCVITQVGDEYYWDSRADRPMMRIDSGAYTTFIALDSSGYVRMIVPEMKGLAASVMGDTETRFDYVEHLVVGLRTVTYYGVRN